MKLSRRNRRATAPDSAWAHHRTLTEVLSSPRLPDLIRAHEQVGSKRPKLLIGPVDERSSYWRLGNIQSCQCAPESVELGLDPPPRATNAAIGRPREENRSVSHVS